MKCCGLDMNESILKIDIYIGAGEFISTLNSLNVFLIQMYNVHLKYLKMYYKFGCGKYFIICLAPLFLIAQKKDL